MIVFVIEAVLKLIALGVTKYFCDGWNTFDFIVTALGVIELGLEGVQGLSVLRAFRLVSLLICYDIMENLFTAVDVGRGWTFSISLAQFQVLHNKSSHKAGKCRRRIEKDKMLGLLKLELKLIPIHCIDNLLIILLPVHSHNSRAAFFFSLLIFTRLISHTLAIYSKIYSNVT